jgi:hypothetical protein
MEAEWKLNGSTRPPRARPPCVGASARSSSPSSSRPSPPTQPDVFNTSGGGPLPPPQPLAWGVAAAQYHATSCCSDCR